MRNVCKGCLVGLAGMLLFSSVASSQTREPNKPIRADEGKTVVDQLSKNGSGGPAPRMRPIRAGTVTRLDTGREITPSWWIR